MAQKFIVVYEYEARYDSELELVKDEVITLITTEDGGWSEGKNEKGKRGWFPTAFVSPSSGVATGGSLAQSPSVALRSERADTNPIYRPHSSSKVGREAPKDDIGTDKTKKKKNRSLFTKSVKLSSEDIKRKSEFGGRKESLLSVHSSSTPLVTPISQSPPNVTHTPPPLSTHVVRTSSNPISSSSSSSLLAAIPPPIIEKNTPIISNSNSNNNTTTNNIKNTTTTTTTTATTTTTNSNNSNNSNSNSNNNNNIVLAGNAAGGEGEFSILENKKKTSNYLTKWLNNRTTKQLLKEKGLLAEEVVDKTETIYGLPLDVILNDHGAPIPRFLSQCVDYLTTTSIKEQGLFRVSGVASVVSTLGQLFAKPNSQITLADYDCHAVSGCVKKFFRELPDPLFTYEAHDAFLSTTTIENKDERAKQFQALFNGLPKPNRDLIQFLLKFLHEVTTHSEVNLMHANNLGVVFGPTLMRSKQDSLSGFMNPTNNSVGTIAALISDFNLIFGDIDSNDQSAVNNSNNNPTLIVASRKRSSDQIKAPTKPNFKPNPPARQHSLSKPPLPAPKVECATALYDYNGDPALSQLSFRAGDTIQIILKHQSGWWTGIVNGKQGLFPMNFIQIS